MNTAQRKVHALIQTSNEGYWHPRNVMKKIHEECRELSREVDRAIPRGRTAPGELAGIRNEAGDLLFAIACLLNPLGIDFDEAVAESIKKFSRRDKHLYLRKPL